MREIALGRASAFPDPGRRVVDVDGIEIGVFCRNGSFTAFENVCPHMGGPVCQGKIIARVKELIAQDKKVKRGMLTFILVRAIGSAVIETGVEERDVRAFLNEKLVGR